MTADSGASASLRASSHNASDRRLVVFVAWLAIAIPAMLVLTGLAAVLPAIPWWTGLVLGAVIALVLVAIQLRGSFARVLAAIGATPADPTTHARAFNLVQGLSLAGGISEPELHVVDDEARNAAAIAQGDKSAIVITSGLLDVIDRIGLEGVVAEALVRIGNGDAEGSTMGTGLFGPMLSGPLASVGKPLAAFGLGRLIGPDRDLAADRAAVALTRYPPGLLAALDLIREGSPAPRRSTEATAHVWLVPPAALEIGAEPVLPSTPLDLRIDVLGEL